MRRRQRCRVCGDVYREILEVRRIESTGFCTECAWSNPFCQPDILSLWRLNRSELDEILAERFALRLEMIRELLEYCTEEELFDLLSEMEEVGTLDGERERFQALEGPPV